MITKTFIEINDDKEVTFIYGNPVNMTEERLSEGYLTDKPIPEPEYFRGKSSDLLYDPTTDEFSFRYVDRPLTEEEKLDIILENQEQLENETAELWYEKMLDEARISEHDSEIAELWYEMMLGGVA